MQMIGIWAEVKLTRLTWSCSYDTADAQLCMCVHYCRAYSSRVHDAEPLDPDEESNKELVHWIPARLLLCASKDADMQQYLIDSVFKNGLFSTKLPAQHAAKQWAAIYMEIDQQVVLCPK